MDVLHPERVSPFYRYEWYENFDYVIIGSGVFQRYQAAPQTYSIQMKFYQKLEQHWQLEQHILPKARVGPEIRIYRNPTSERPDTGFDPRLYRSLKPTSKRASLNFLNVLEYALKGGGYKNRARNVATMIGMVKQINIGTQQQ
jgi:hypothetical protein